MQSLIRGIHQFQTQLFSSHRELFERLAAGQSPETLFITCSDSRINPNLVTQTQPGELFILRNVGNIVPHGDAPPGAAASAIEYAAAVLRVRDIILCGHSHCGAMSCLLDPDSLKGLPATTSWLRHAAETRRIVRECYGHLSGDALVMAAVAENVLVQLENLRTHPTVAERMAAGDLKVHGWVYKLETGEVFAYHPEEGQFLPITEETAGVG